MADGMLSVKLAELDQRVGKIYSRIELLRTAEHGRIQEELAQLKKECEENEIALGKKIKFSKSPVIVKFAESYDELKEIIMRTEDELGLAGAREPAVQLDTEQKILFAEYSLDFAMRSADRALLAAYEAIDAQMADEEKGEEAV